MKKSIGILGGMGPLATADLLRKIVLLTAAEGDGGHIRIYVDDNPAIPDRTAAILHGGPDPLPTMTESLRKLEGCGADCILMPCNTAHYFLPALQALTPIPFLSILDSTAQACRRQMSGRTAALLATTGTLSAQLYQPALTAAEVPFLLPDDTERAALMRVIYDGVKAGAAEESYRDDLLRVTDGLRRRGADYFILGCTELPLAFQSLDCPAIDPTEELAKAAIRFCGYPVRGENASAKR